LTSEPLDGRRAAALTRSHADLRVLRRPSRDRHRGAVTPTGSQASIIFGTDVRDTSPGSADRLLLLVQDIEVARANLAARGVDVSEVFHGTGFRADGAGRVPGLDPERCS